ncbi:MAG: hypothetical protein ABW224_10500 [Kibdelosporangium sp.]
MSGISEDELSAFCQHINDFRDTTLTSDAQRAFLDAILKTAWSFAAKEDSLQQGFDGCFEPAEAEDILAFSAAEGDVDAKMIRGLTLTGTLHSSMIRGSALGSMIRGTVHGYIK